MSLTNAAYGIFVLPESLPLADRDKFSWRKANPLGAVRLLARAPGLFKLAVVDFLFWLSRVALTSVFVLYGTYRYGWDAAAIGLTFAGVGVCSAVVGGGLVKPVVARVGERAGLMIGLLCGAAGMAIFGLAAHPLLFWAGIPLMSLIGLAAPSLQGLMTARIDPHEQGQLQGALGSVTALASMVGPLLFSFVFAQSISATPILHHSIPGAPFFLSALLLLGAMALVMSVKQDAALLAERAGGHSHS